MPMGVYATKGSTRRVATLPRTSRDRDLISVITRHFTCALTLGCIRITRNTVTQSSSL